MIMTSGYFNSTFCFYFALKWEVLNSLFPFFYQSSSIMSMLLRLTILPYYSLWLFLTLCWSARNWLLTFSWFHFQCYMDISTLKKKRYSMLPWIQANLPNFTQDKTTRITNGNKKKNTCLQFSFGFDFHGPLYHYQSLIIGTFILILNSSFWKTSK